MERAIRPLKKDADTLDDPSPPAGCVEIRHLQTRIGFLSCHDRSILPMKPEHLVRCLPEVILCRVAHSAHSHQL